jgi:PAS domain S-box-containing protein
MEKALRRQGHSTVVASSGREALAWLEQQQPDLLLLDLKLPDMPGPEIVRQLSEKKRNVPFVIITGQGDERVAVEMMKQGAWDYLVKDKEFLDLFPAVVERTLRQIDQARKLAVAEESLRLSQEALRREHAFVSALLNTAGALVVVLDREGRIVRFNPACERATGYRFDEVRGKLFWELFIAPEELAAVREVFEELKAGRFPNQHENDWITRDGDRRLIAWSNAALLSAAGEVEYVIATGIDITEHKRLEKEILQISEIEQRRIGQDLHDGLCQHLAGIELMTQVLEQSLSRKRKGAAAQAAKIGEHVRESISQTKMLARGLSPVGLEANGLMSALEELAVNTEHLFQVECSFEYDTPVLMTDNTVATHLYRIAQESVSNAIKHGRARRIRVQLTNGQGTILLKVIDDGIGLSSAVSNEKGMGMRIMQYRAGMIGASLETQSNPEGGTSVVCLLNRPLPDGPVPGHSPAAALPARSAP